MGFTVWDADNEGIGTRVGGGFDGWLEIVYRQHHNFKDVRCDPINWAPLDKPLSEARVALVTTGGVHHVDDEPFDVLALEGDSTFRTIPSDTPPGELRITHSHYNHQEADEDIDCVFPIQTLYQMEEDGEIGSIAEMFYGMMGFIPEPTRFVEVTSETVASGLVHQEVDFAVLTPG